MSFRKTFHAFNRRVARVLVMILSPLLLTLIWITVGLSCVIPRLLGTPFLIPYRRGGDSPWLEHDPVDTSLRGLGRQG